jgi:hypothetical protein
MSVPPDSTLANLQQTIADLRRELAQLTAQRDKLLAAQDDANLRLDDAQAREAATAEVLQVINSSPGNLTPVFESMLEKAHALCGVTYGSLQLWDGTLFRAVAVHGLPEALAKRLREGYVPSPSARRLIEGADFASPAYPLRIFDRVSRLADADRVPKVSTHRNAVLIRGSPDSRSEYAWRRASYSLRQSQPFPVRLGLAYFGSGIRFEPRLVPRRSTCSKNSHCRSDRAARTASSRKSTGCVPLRVEHADWRRR